MRATIDATAARLSDERGLVYRYLAADGLEGEEGTFLLCTFWLAHAQALAGELDRARATFEAAAGFANDVGLLSEEVDPRTGELLGNFPQAFSHIGLVNAAWAIAEAERGQRQEGPMILRGPRRRRATRTLAIDVGGSGLKAAVLDATGAIVGDRARVPTPYPCPPEVLVGTLRDLVAALPSYGRVSVGFPGMVRSGWVLSAPNLSRVAGPGSKISADVRRAWTGVDLAGSLEEALGAPARVVNDAEMQGAAVVLGRGLELVVTLGTGCGTAVFLDGRLAPHLELGQHPFRKDRTYDEVVGDSCP